MADVCIIVKFSLRKKKKRNHPSAIYNAMVHPFLPMPVYGAIWYQGNAAQDCAIVETFLSSFFQH